MAIVGNPPLPGSVWAERVEQLAPRPRSFTPVSFARVPDEAEDRDWAALRMLADKAEAYEGVYLADTVRMDGRK